MEWIKLICAIALTLLLASYVKAENDSQGQGQPAPLSVEDFLTSFRDELEGAPAVETPPEDILRNSTFKLKLRNYYLSRTRPENNDPLAWAQGGSLEYKVDKVAGIFGLNAEYFGSFKLYAPDDRDGTLLLEPGQNNIDTLGVLNPKLTYRRNILSLYRQRIDLPYVNSQDNRMIPNTFEAYTLAMPKTENETFQYVLGYIDEIKKRNDEIFRSMSEVAGVTSGDRGMILGGARYFFCPELSLGAVNYYVDDVLNIFYSEAVHKWKFDEDLGNAFSVQYADQRSTGDDLLRGEEFSTNMWGVQDATSYKFFTLKAAVTLDDGGGDLRSPYGTYPGYNSSIFEDFNRAGEKAWQIGLMYNFAGVGLNGLGISTAYVHGTDAINELTKEGLPNKGETDVTIDYKVTEGVLNGFWLRLRGAWIDEDGKGMTEDYRIIVNYELRLYEPEKAASAAS